MQLTKSNAEIIRLLADGKTAKEIAAETGLKKRTIDQRISRMLKQYNCRTRTQLVLKAVAFNLAAFAGKA